MQTRIFANLTQVAALVVLGLAYTQCLVQFAGIA